MPIPNFDTMGHANVGNMTMERDCVCMLIIIREQLLKLCSTATTIYSAEKCKTNVT